MALTKVRGSGLDGATALKGQELVIDADGDTSIDASSADDTIIIDTAGSERARIDSSGNFFVSATATSGFQSSSSESGSIIYAAGGIASNSASNDVAGVFNRLGDDGNVLTCKKDGTPVLELGSVGGLNGFVEGTGDRAGLTFGGADVTPRKNSTGSDNAVDLGHGSLRFDDIFATNGTINTSDQNEKQDIATATTKELNVAKKLSSLFKTFRWKDRVAEKGDKARTHTGIIAQEVQSAFKAEGLDASNYGLFTLGTWWEKDGDRYFTEEEAPSDATKKERLGVRYPELFSFIFSSIEARLTALESK